VGDGKSDANGRGGAKPEPEVAQKAEFDTDLPQDDANTAEAPPAKSAGSLNGLHAYREASHVYVGPTATIAWLTCKSQGPGFATRSLRPLSSLNICGGRTGLGLRKVSRSAAVELRRWRNR